MTSNIRDIAMNHLLDNSLCQTIGVAHPLADKLQHFAKWLLTGFAFELASIHFEPDLPTADVQVSDQMTMILMQTRAHSASARAS